MIVGALSPEQVREYWPHIRPFFENFEERTQGDVDADQLFEEVQDGQRQCWAAIGDKGVQAVALTEVAGLRGRVWVEYCAGERREEWQDQIMDAIEAWAKDNGSPGVLTFSRTGWTPFLKGRGYRETHRIMEKCYGQG